MTMESEADQLLRAKINLDTARVNWNELTRFFARGVLFRVSVDLDLVDVAFALARDNKEQVEQWTRSGLLRVADDDDAGKWHRQNAILWATVAAPWVLVQEIKQSP